MFRSVIAIGLIFLTTMAAAQRRGGVSRSAGAEVTVRILYDNSRPAGEQLRVILTNQMGMTIAEQYSDSRGEVRFQGIRAGAYRIRVTGFGIEDSVGDTFAIEPLDVLSSQMVTVKRTAQALAAEKASGPPVSAAELNIPDKARKEFEKGKQSLQKSKSDEALKHFAKATEIYPQYAAAYDAMGTMVAGTSPTEAKRYFQQALDADKQYVPAYTHLAKAYMAEKNYADAESLLTKSNPLNPRSAEDLFLMAYAQSKQGKYDAAIQTTERTHQLDHEQFALVHFVAADAYSRLGKRDDAVAQYSMYLKEAPLGPSAEIAKKNIKVLQAQTAQTQAPPK